MAVLKQKENTATLEDVIKATPSLPEIVIKTLTPKELAEQEDRRMVTGIFHYLQKRGGILRISPMAKYKGDPLAVVEEYVDGKRYTIPKWKADWLNGEENEMKTPFAHDLAHTEQYQDITQKHPLAPPKTIPLYSFTPEANWK